ncbi:MAG: hypothetical protein WA783_10835 [Phormidesmis sp.]
MLVAVFERAFEYCFRSAAAIGLLLDWQIYAPWHAYMGSSIQAK